MKEVRKERQHATPRKRRRRIAAVLIPAALLGLGATGYAMLRADQVVAGGIACYDAPNTSANVTVIPTTGDGPKEVCAELWSQGIVRRGVSEAPTLTPCVNEPGAVLVFPSDEPEICTRLGLQDLPEGYEAAAKRFLQMKDVVVTALYEEATANGVDERDACLDEATALRVATSALSEHGFDDWRTEIATGDYRGRTCANYLGFDSARKTVLIIPSEPGIDSDYHSIN